MREFINLLVEAQMYLGDKGTTYWNHAGKYEAEMGKLWKELVPGSGPAETLAGEVLRCVSKIYYRHFNDGDSFTVDSFAFLKKNIGHFTTYDEMVDRAVEFAMDPEHQAMANNFDSVRELKIYEGPESGYDDDEDEDEY
jgi:hypothetical protein